MTGLFDLPTRGICMRNVVLFIAVSLDGYIADSNGNVDWLVGQNDNGEAERSYLSFIKETDTVVMGWNTYQQIVTELSPDIWPYGGLKTYVVTHRQSGCEGEVCFTDEQPADLVRRLKEKDGKGIWICGGATIVEQVMKADLIDRWHISMTPMLLGDGIRLFEKTDKRIALRLIETCSYNGVTDLVYERR